MNFKLWLNEKEEMFNVNFGSNSKKDISPFNASTIYTLYNPQSSTFSTSTIITKYQKRNASPFSPSEPLKGYVTIPASSFSSKSFAKK